MNTNPRLGGWHDRLAGVTFSNLAGEFIRYRDDAADDVVGGVVREIAAQGADAADEFRSRLHEPEVEDLRLFAMRRTLQGRRRASLGALTEAMSAFALLPRVEDVPWESWLKGALFLGRALGANVDTVAQSFYDLADGDGEARMGVATEAMDRVETLTQCHLSEVATTYGAGFVETLVFRGNATIGLFGAPNRIGQNALSFEPATNLAQLAANVADAIDAKGHATTPLGQDQLAATSFSMAVAGSYVATTGCLSCVAEGTASEPSFNVVVAEVPDDVDVTELAAAAEDTDEQRAVYDGRRLIILSAVPDFSGDDHPDTDLGPFVDLARTVINGAAASSSPS